MRTMHAVVFALAAVALTACGESENAATTTPAAPADPSVALAKTNPEAACRGWMERLEKALAAWTGVPGARTKADGELDEAAEALEKKRWNDCFDALDEAFEALGVRAGYAAAADG